MTNHLFDALLGNAKPDAPFAETAGGAARRYSYGDVLDLSARFAATLAASGVRPGDRVAAQVPKSVDAVLLYLATLRAGAVFLPLNTAYTASEVDGFLRDAEPAIFVCDLEREAELRPIAECGHARLMTMDARGEGSFPDAVVEDASGFENVARTPDDLAAILYTSGTTGRSKGAMLTHANLASNASVLVAEWRFTARDRLLHALPIFHTHGLFVAINTALAAGASLVWLERFDPGAVLEALPHSTVMMGVPTFYTRLLCDERFDREAVEHMRLFTSGSAPLLAETHRRFETVTGQRILERYGMTETNMNTSNPYEGERRAGTVGPPLPGVELRIVADGRAVGTDEVGTIQVRGPNVFSGYWRMPDKTAEEFTADGWFITGDLGEQSEDGYVTIVGRSKDVVITGGFNVYPVEVEAAIDGLDDVTESAVVGLPHDDFGEAVTAFVVAHAATDETAILRGIEDGLARYKQPKRIVFVDALPRNAMGKVQKAALRSDHAQLYTAPTPAVF